MFWTAFVWGLGASLGAAGGLLSFVVCFWCLQWMAGRSKAVDAARQVAEGSLLALNRRNELTEEQLDHLSFIANAARQYTASLAERK